jgi:ankyrin repeat protein
VAPLSVIKLLLTHGGTVTDTDAVAQGVIGHIRGRLDRLEVVEYLLDYGAPIDVYAYKNYERCQSLIKIEGLENGLHRATRAGNREMVDLLLKRGADIKYTTGRVTASRDRWDLTALDIARTKGFDDIASLLINEEVVL